MIVPFLEMNSKRYSKPTVVGSYLYRGQVGFFSTCRVWVRSLGVAPIYIHEEIS